MIELADLTVPAGCKFELAVHGPGSRAHAVDAVLFSRDRQRIARRQWTRDQVRHEPIDLQAAVDAMAAEISGPVERVDRAIRDAGHA
jgi:hypothetical protein